jgi:hypothetical protein
MHIPTMGYFSCMLCKKAADAPAAFVFCAPHLYALYFTHLSGAFIPAAQNSGL